MIFTTIAVVMLGTAGSTMADGAEPADQTAVEASQLLVDVTIVGKLGVPLGETVTIHGNWQRSVSTSSKEPTNGFRVTHVNDKALATPVVFAKIDLKEYHAKLTTFPWDGDIWELQGYESGEVLGMPDQAWMELGLPAQSSTGCHFATRFVYSKGWRLREASSHKPSPLTSDATTGAKEKKTPLRTVNASDLLRGIAVISKLKCPLGNMVIIRGSRYEPNPNATKSSEPRFRITHINGKLLKLPIDYDPMLMWPSAIPGGLITAAPLDGDQWELQGYETGYTNDLSLHSTVQFPEALASPFIVGFNYVRACRVK
jgi:hypothetical protein